MQNFDTHQLFALTVKYTLHPLSVEDVIEQCQTKIDRQGSLANEGSVRVCPVSSSCLILSPWAFELQERGVHLPGDLSWGGRRVSLVRRKGLTTAHHYESCVYHLLGVPGNRATAL